MIPNKATVQLAVRRASTGATVTGSGSATNATDNAIMLGATYAIALNVRGELTYSKYSGDVYNAANLANTTGDTMTKLDLVFGF